MNATPTTPNLPTPEHNALVFAARFTVIIASLVALIARGFLRDPQLALLTIPLCRRLTRSARDIATIMARLAAGNLRPRHRPATTGGGRAPKPPIPATEAWLVRTLHHEAAGYASQLSHLLAQPGVPELLAAAPTTGRLLRPLCRMLGISAAAGDRRASSRTPDTPPPDAQRSGAASIATGALPRQRQQRSRVARAGRPESAVEPSRTESAPPPPAPTTPPPPLCPRLRLRWPFHRPSAKPA